MMVRNLERGRTAARFRTLKQPSGWSMTVKCSFPPPLTAASPAPPPLASAIGLALANGVEPEQTRPASCSRGNSEEHQRFLPH